MSRSKLAAEIGFANRAARRFGDMQVTSRSSRVMLPLPGMSSPANKLNNVVLPAQLGPMMAWRIPAGSHGQLQSSHPTQSLHLSHVDTIVNDNSEHTSAYSSFDSGRRHSYSRLLVKRLHRCSLVRSPVPIDKPVAVRSNPTVM